MTRKNDHSGLVNFAAGGLGGSVGALVTCPLEVIQTRLQSSAFSPQKSPAFRLKVSAPAIYGSANFKSRGVMTMAESEFRGILPYGRFMIETEGFRALFKGLGPTLLGVTPSRAIYFAIYSKTKDFLNRSGHMTRDSAPVHMTSAAFASFVNHTVTNPLWFIKTRLQLDNRGGKRTSALQLVRESYNSEGVRVFYRGLTASYFGIFETVIHFALYEHIKARILTTDHNTAAEITAASVLAAGSSKLMATSLCYPHEVARTRLRQQQSEFLGAHKYRSFVQTLGTVAAEEGWRGLYRGLATHVLRQIPNTAVIFFTYEAVVHCLEPQ